MPSTDRRRFIQQSLASGAAAACGLVAPSSVMALADKPSAKMRLGLCTYLWGKDWDLPTLLANCEKTQIYGVELRTGHRHNVEPTLTKQQRASVKKMFEASPVTFVGPGSAECFDHPDPERLKAAIEKTKAFVMLSHDCGGSGVKVRPNNFHPNVPREKTIEQIARSLDEVGKFAADYGQEIRLEIHGSCGAMEPIKQIIDQVRQKNVGLCWNCNGDELLGKGLAYHFDRLRKRFAGTLHVRELDDPKYPYAELIKLLVNTNYAGLVLLECRTTPTDYIAALNHQRELFEQMVAKAQG